MLINMIFKIIGSALLDTIGLLNIVVDVLNSGTYTLIIVTRFDMAAQTMTPEVEEDLRLLKVRLYPTFYLFYSYQFSIPHIASW